MAREARKLLAEAAAKELKGEEGVKLLKAFRDEAKAAEGDGGDDLVAPSLLKRQAFMHAAFQFWRLAPGIRSYRAFSFILRHSSTPISVS